MRKDLPNRRLRNGFAPLDKAYYVKECAECIVERLGQDAVESEIQEWCDFWSSAIFGSSPIPDFTFPLKIEVQRMMTDALDDDRCDWEDMN